MYSFPFPQVVRNVVKLTQIPLEKLTSHCNVRRVVYVQLVEESVQFVAVVPVHAGAIGRPDVARIFRPILESLAFVDFRETQLKLNVLQLVNIRRTNSSRALRLDARGSDGRGAGALGLEIGTHPPFSSSYFTPVLFESRDFVLFSSAGDAVPWQCHPLLPEHFSGQ